MEKSMIKKLIEVHERSKGEIERDLLTNEAKRKELKKALKINAECIKNLNVRLNKVPQ